jgi:hypothetical protein
MISGITEVVFMQEASVLADRAQHRHLFVQHKTRAGPSPLFDRLDRVSSASRHIAVRRAHLVMAQCSGIAPARATA